MTTLRDIKFFQPELILTRYPIKLNTQIFPPQKEKQKFNSEIWSWVILKQGTINVYISKTACVYIKQTQEIKQSQTLQS